MSEAVFREVGREEAAAAFVELWNREYPESPETVEAILSALRHNEPGAPEEFHLASIDGQPVALLLLDIDSEDVVDRLEGDYLVHADHAREMTPTAVEKCREIIGRLNLKEISFWCGDRIPARAEELKRGGLEITQVVNVTRLDIEAFDPKPFQEKIDKVRERFRIVSAAELDDEGFDWIPGLWEVAWEMLQDMPNPHEPVRPTLENYRERIREEKIFYQTDTMMLAMEGDRVVGYSRVTLSPAKADLAMTGLSGTARDCRRMGIVTALKVEGIKRMRAKGIKWLQTDNDETNPMYDLNIQMGYEPCWLWNRWRLGADA